MTLKNILLILSFTTCISLAYSQAVIQGFSMGYGGKGIKKSSDFEINALPETDSLPARSLTFNEPDSKGSYSVFAMDYFLKMRYKKFYFKTNLGFNKFGSKTRTHRFFGPYFWEYDKGREYTAKYSEWYFMNGYGIDYILTKNLTIGYNFQFGLYYLAGGGSRPSALETDTYYDYGTNLNYFDLTYSSFDIEYVHDIFGIKYSYIMTPDARSVHQFGVTYNLKYDWKEVAQ